MVLTPKSIKIAYLEPFYGGSHRAFVDGLVAGSRHRITLFTLPDRFWKWRTRGAALEFFKALPDPSGFDLVAASDMLNLAELQGLWRKRVSTVLYMHENQLTYPLPDDTTRDANYIMSDLLSAMSATRVAFNSHAHKDAFFSAATAFSKRMPDCNPGWIVSLMEAKSSVLYPGVDLNDENLPHFSRTPVDEGVSPVLLWNHRWEYDKAPTDFLKVLQRLKKDNVEFKLVLLGDRAESSAPVLEQIVKQFSKQLLFSGYVRSKDEYRKWLRTGDIVISTAIQENFGIACIEAMHEGCYPLLPNRLSYPEIVPPALHDDCLYRDLDDLVDRIKNWRPQNESMMHRLRDWTHRYRWDAVIDRFDAYFETIE